MMSVRPFLASLVFSLAFSHVGVTSAARWYVDGSVSASGDGKSWETAFKRIQEGIDAASDGDTVTVEQEMYTENVHFNGNSITLTSTDPLDSVVVEKTVIDGGAAGTVVTFSGDEDQTCLLWGFTIRNGDAEVGGGICGGGLDSHTHATIRNNVVTGNTARKGAGLAYCDGTITDNTISGNSADYGGGLHECHGTIENNIITDNSAMGDSLPRGGGLAGCHGVVQYNTISGNYGAGLVGSSGRVQNNRITGNFGGGLHGCGGLIQNNLITENSSQWAGGGLCECSGTIQNNTIAGNNGDGIFGCKGIIRNCIVWGNTEESGGGGSADAKHTPLLPPGRHGCQRSPGDHSETCRPGEDIETIPRRVQ